MKAPGGAHLKTIILICFIVISAPLGNVLLAKGMKGIGAIHNYAPAPLFQVLGRVLVSGSIWLGIASLMTFFVAYMLVLSWADYSYVQPASAVAYVITALLGCFCLGEPVAPLRWAGIAVICLGVFVVGRTPPRTTEPG